MKTKQKIKAKIFAARGAENSTHQPAHFATGKMPYVRHRTFPPALKPCFLAPPSSAPIFANPPHGWTFGGSYTNEKKEKNNFREQLIKKWRKKMTQMNSTYVPIQRRADAWCNIISTTALVLFEDLYW